MKLLLHTFRQCITILFATAWKNQLWQKIVFAQSFLSFFFFLSYSTRCWLKAFHVAYDFFTNIYIIQYILYIYNIYNDFQCRKTTTFKRKFFSITFIMGSSVLNQRDLPEQHLQKSYRNPKFCILLTYMYLFQRTYNNYILVWKNCYISNNSLEILAR